MSESFNDRLAARLEEKAAYVLKQVRELLGERYTQDDLLRALLFDAAWARVLLEDQRQETEKAEGLFIGAMKIAEEAKKLAEEALTQLKKSEAGHEQDLRDLSERAAAFHALVDQTNKALFPLAEKGQQFSDKRRGLSRLYRHALEILKAHGQDTPAKLVRRKLESAGMARAESEYLLWKDDKGRNKKTPVHEFDKNLSRLRGRIG